MTPFLKLEDFAAIKINWQTKPENILEICNDFNIKPKNVLFVDDNPVEREAVRAMLPGIRVIGSNPYLTRRILLNAPETQVAHLTAESAGRETAIRGQIVREEKRKTLNREAFLASLKSAVTFIEIRSKDHAAFARVVELVNKTNQFNTNGKRWAAEDIARFFQNDGYILAFQVKDRFAEYGLVGCIFVSQAEIIQMVMSCRVMGMEIEECAVAHTVNNIRAKGNVSITAWLVETPDNAPCQTVFTQAGFTETPNNNPSRLFVFSPDQQPIMPAHIDVSSEQVKTEEKPGNLSPEETEPAFVS